MWLKWYAEKIHKILTIFKNTRVCKVRNETQQWLVENFSRGNMFNDILNYHLEDHEISTSEFGQIRLQERWIKEQVNRSHESDSQNWYSHHQRMQNG